MSRYTVINISKRDFSVFINARIRPFCKSGHIYSLVAACMAIANDHQAKAMHVYFFHATAIKFTIYIATLNTDDL